MVGGMATLVWAQSLSYWKRMRTTWRWAIDVVAVAVVVVVERTKKMWELNRLSS